MLEQRSAQQKGYITLREAADISDYAPDYIGQLIRAGKIQGEQVYSSVAWVTTEESVKAYMAAKNKSTHVTEAGSNVEEAVENFGLYIWYLIAGALAIATLLLFYIFAVSIDSFLEQRVLEASLPEPEHVLLVDLYE